MKIQPLFTVLTLIAIALFSFGCQNSSQNNSTKRSFENQGQATVIDEESKANILQIARNSQDHTTLAKAIEAAGVQNILVNAGPLTVFAPTNAAFEQLPEGTVGDLLKPENKQKLANIITSHASPANLSFDQLTEDRQIYLATGQYVGVEVKDGEKYVNGAKVLASVEASNGVIHVVDKVFLF
ncbi:MAG: fasciclin domain-containing protein [Balneolaceae bacterium]|nr:fasciclin domain-containing protein [Balneolaceae bacterium]